MNSTFIAVIVFGSVVTTLLILPWILSLLKASFKTSRYSSMGESSKIRLVKQLESAVEYLSGEKTGGIITIVNKDPIDNFRTDGIKINAAISASLIIAIFNKKSPLHDGAIVIDNNQITYASTYYKITNKSISNKYGARHRASMWISEQTDSLTIVVSEENGRITFAKGGQFTHVKMSEFQTKLTDYIQ